MISSRTEAYLSTFAAATPWDVYSMLGPIPKLAASIALLAAAGGLVLAVIRRVSNGPQSGFLNTCGVIGLLFGVLGALYSGFNCYIAAKETHTTDLLVMLPVIIETAYVFLFGFLAWAIAQVGNAGARRP